MIAAFSYRLVLGALAATLLLVASGTAMATSTATVVGSYELKARGSGGFGYDGFWFGPFEDHKSHENRRKISGTTTKDTHWDYDTSTLHTSVNNFKFVDVKLDVFDDGSAEISGKLERHYNSEDWAIASYKLDDAQFKKKNGSRVDVDTLTTENLMNLFEGKSLDGNDWSHKDGWGLEWESLSLELDKLGNHSSLKEDEWYGLAMSGMGHINPAELHWVDGELQYDAWYYNNDPKDLNSSWKKENYYYAAGDTKADVHDFHAPEVPESEPGTTPIPEPMTGALGMIALLAAGAAATRRRRA